VPLSINPEQTPAFRPGIVEGLIQGLVQKGNKKDFFNSLSGNDGKQDPKGRLVWMLLRGA